MRCTATAAVLLIVAAFPSITHEDGNRSDVEAARHILRGGIDSRNSDSRVQAITAASMIGRNDVDVRRLEAALDDKDVRVRIAAVGALADLKSYRSRPQLRRVMRSDKVPEVEFAAAKALYALKDPAGKQALIDVLEKKMDPSSGLVRTEARNFFRNFQSTQSAAAFIVREGIGYVPIPGVGEGFSAMMRILSDPELSARASVVLLLGNEKGPEAQRVLEDGLRDKDWSVRAAAVQMVAHTGRVNMLNLLPPLFNDKKEKVQFRAAGAYLHLAVRASH